MSSRAVVIPFHRYQPHEGVGYHILFEYFLEHLPLWADEFDRLYIIDSDMNFSTEDLRMLQKIKPGTRVLKKEIEGHHWVQYKWILPMIEEENMLMLDNDVVFTKKGVVDSWFKAIEEGYDFVGSFDNSGGLQEQVRNAFPFMKENNFNRMGSYYFVWTKKLLEKINYFDFAPISSFPVPTYIPELDYTTKEGDWCDSFGMFTIKMLATNPKIKIIEDPRDTIYLQPEIIEGAEKWKISREPEDPINHGYYHIRNGNLANYVLTSKISHENDYTREINGNKRELLRSLAWFSHMGDYDGTQIMQLVKDMGVKYKDFLEYYEEFEKYHAL